MTTKNRTLKVFGIMAAFMICVASLCFSVRLYNSSPALALENAGTDEPSAPGHKFPDLSDDTSIILAYMQEIKSYVPTPDPVRFEETDVTFHIYVVNDILGDKSYLSPDVVSVRYEAGSDLYSSKFYFELKDDYVGFDVSNKYELKDCVLFYVPDSYRPGYLGSLPCSFQRSLLSPSGEVCAIGIIFRYEEKAVPPGESSGNGTPAWQQSIKSFFVDHRNELIIGLAVIVGIIIVAAIVNNVGRPRRRRR